MLLPLGRKETETASTLPEASTSYEPLLKKELGHRILAISLAFLAFEYLLYLIPSLDISRGQQLGLLPHLAVTAVFALVTFAFGALPLLALRGRTLSDKFTSLSSRGQIFLALISTSRVWRTLAYFAASGFSLAWIYVAWINLTEWHDPKLSVLSPTRRNIFRINERFVYIAFFNASLGLLLAARDILRQRHVPKWPRHDDPSNLVSSSSITITILDTVFAFLNPKSITSTALITLIHLVLYPFWYHSFRALLLPSLRNIPVISVYTRPLLHAFARTWSIDVPWARLFSLGFRTAFAWEFVQSAFDYWVTRPINVTQSLPNPDPILVAGIHSKDRYFKHHAYIELAALIRSTTPAAASRRTNLFSNTKTNPTLWNALLRELLLSLGQDYQCLIRRGKPPPAPPPPQAQAPSTKEARASKTPVTPLIRRPDIIRPSPKSFFDALSSPTSNTAGTMAKITTDAAATVKEQVPTFVPKVFLPSSSSSSSPITTATPVKRVERKIEPVVAVVKKEAAIPTRHPRVNYTAAVMSFFTWIERKLPREWGVGEWWTKKSVERETMGSVPDVYLDVVRIEVLSRLVSASLTEDPIGIVQRDIPRVLEALTSFLDVAESYQAELEKMIPPQQEQENDRLSSSSSSFEDQRDQESLRDVARGIELVASLVQALRAGVGLVCKTFNDRLGVYRFPPKTAQRIQGFMDCL